MFAVVHDADHDRAGIRCDLDEIETGLPGGTTGIVNGNDADLLPVGTDEANRAQANLLVDADFLFYDAEYPPWMNGL
jgi:hypothetical protein